MAFQRDIMPTITSDSSLQFFPFPARWLVRLIKMSTAVLVMAKHNWEMILVRIWGAGIGGRDLVSICWWYYFWPALWKSSAKTLALILKLLDMETNQAMEVGFQIFFFLIASSLLFCTALFCFKNWSCFFVFRLYVRRGFIQPLFFL